MKKTSKRLLGRVLTIGLAVLTQVVWIIFAVVVLRNRFPFVAALISILSIVAILWITSKDINPSYKLAWTTLILAVPIVGAVIYLLFGKTWIGKETQQKLDEAEKKAAAHKERDEAARETQQGGGAPVCLYQ